MHAVETTQVKIFFWTSDHAVRKTGDLDVGVACVSKSLIPLYQTTRRHITVDNHLHKRNRENFISCLTEDKTACSEAKQKFITQKIKYLCL